MNEQIAEAWEMRSIILSPLLQARKISNLSPLSFSLVWQLEPHTLKNEFSTEDFVFISYFMLWPHLF